MPYYSSFVISHTKIPTSDPDEASNRTQSSEQTSKQAKNLTISCLSLWTGRIDQQILPLEMPSVIGAKEKYVDSGDGPQLQALLR